MREMDRKRIPSPDAKGRPHVVILGAGASKAAFPDGDRNGRKLPLLHEIVEIVGLGAILDKAGIGESHNDFEKLYSELVTSGQNPELVTQLNRAIYDYFVDLRLPDQPTLYDHLVLSLRNKDIIATFNWDPLLWQALDRNWRPKKLPSPLFLHGNTAIGVCMDHKPAPVRPRGQLCPNCRKPMQENQLLFPVDQKNYSRSPFIAKNWELLQRNLEDAYLLTIFGYSAPATDVEAVDLLKSAWGDPNQRPQEEIEIIDIKSDEELHSTWSPFIHSHHYRVCSDFNESIIAQSPRRSCETTRSYLIDINPIAANPIPQGQDWNELHDFFDVLLDDERQSLIS